MKLKRIAGFLLSAVMITASLNIGFADGTTNADTADVEATDEDIIGEDATDENSTETTTEASTETTTQQYSSSSASGGILVKFDYNNGKSSIHAGIKKGSTLAEPTEPTYDGYIFTGWYTDKECTELYDFTSIVTSDFILYAGWKADDENTTTETTTAADSTTETTTVRHTSGGGGGSSSSVRATTTTTTTEAATETTTDVIETTTEATTAAIISNDVKVYIGSNSVVVGDNSYTIDAVPYIHVSSNSTLVPLRFVATAILGDDIENADNSSIIGWNAETKTASVTVDDNVIQFTANSNIMNINGNSVSMDNGVVAEITDGRMFIPFRDLGEALGVDVDWDSDTKTAVYSSY